MIIFQLLERDFCKKQDLKNLRFLFDTIFNIRIPNPISVLRSYRGDCIVRFLHLRVYSLSVFHFSRYFHQMFKSLTVAVSSVASAAAPAAKIEIILDTPQVPIGGTVTGVVVLTVSHSIEGNSVEFAYNCKELAHTEGYNRRRAFDEDQISRIDTDDEFVNLASISRTLATSNTGSFDAGRFEFPFTITLDPSLPPSVKATAKPFAGQGTKNFCSITYSLEAKLTREGGLFKKYKIEDTKEVIVTPIFTTVPAFEPRTPVVVGPVPTEFHSCCFNRGKVELGISALSWYLPNEVIEVSFVIQNDSYESIEELYIGFYEIVRWKTANFSQFEEKKAEIKITPSLADLSSVRRGGKALNGEELYQDLVNKKKKVALTIPSWALPCFSTRYITVTHAVVMRGIIAAKDEYDASRYLRIEYPFTLHWKTLAPGGTLPPSLKSLIGVNDAIDVAEDVAPVSLDPNHTIGGYRPVSTMDSIHTTSE